MPVVNIPPPYRGPTGGAGAIEVEGATLRAALEAVEARHPGFGELIFDAGGAVHKFVTLFVNGDEVARDAVDEAVAPDDQIEVIAAIAGG